MDAGQTPAAVQAPPSPPLGYQDAVDEALIAVEQVVIPRHQPIELLPRTPEVLNMQVSRCSVKVVECGRCGWQHKWFSEPLVCVLSCRQSRHHDTHIRGSENHLEMR